MQDKIEKLKSYLNPEELFKSKYEINPFRFAGCFIGSS